MTLNLLVASRQAVYLSGDFCLFYPNENKSITDVTVQKLIPVGRYDWNALVSFCGIAKTPAGLDVDRWIVQNVNAGDKGESVDEFVGRLTSSDTWLSDCSNRDRILTVCICGFHGRRPFIICLSTVEQFNGPLSNRPMRRLVRTGLKPKDPQLFVFGMRDACQKTSRDRLRSLIRDRRQNYLDVMRQISIANSDAAQNSDRISAEYVVGHLVPVGTGEVTPYGIEDGTEYMPGFVTEQLTAMGITGFEVKVDEDGKPLKPRWKGMTLKSERVEGRGELMFQFHAFGNVAKPIGDISKGDGTKVFWEIAGENEPKRVCVNVNWPKERKKVPKTWPPKLRNQ
jgi:hypothetical protein